MYYMYLVLIYATMFYCNGLLYLINMFNIFQKTVKRQALERTNRRGGGINTDSDSDTPETEPLTAVKTK